jgi:cytidine deaminase
MTNATSNADTLIALATAARENAYAPYSKYKVGCALATADGTTFTGANVENASYGLCACAERNAIAAAVCAGHREIAAIAIVTQSSPPAAPCGMCRQTINEFVSDPSKVAVILVNPQGERRDIGFAELFPYGFRGSDITD